MRGRQRNASTNSAWRQAAQEPTTYLLGATSEKLLAGSLAAGKEVPGVRRMPNESGVREIREGRLIVAVVGRGRQMIPP